MKIGNIYFEIAGVVIQFSLQTTKNVVEQEIFINNLNKYWGKFKINKKKIDKTIVVKEFAYKIFRKNNDYYLNKYRKLGNKYELAYSSSALDIDLILRDILLEKQKYDSLLFHASAVMNRNGNAYVFIAKSGGGKSTIAKNLHKIGYNIIADDAVILRKINGFWTIYSTPFLEKTKYPVKKHSSKIVLLRIHKSKKCQSKIISDQFVEVKNIADSLWTPNGNLDKTTLSNIMDLSSKAKMYDLFVNLKPREIQKELIKCIN